MRITLLPGDGIGPEVTEQAEKILEIVAKKYNVTIEKDTGYIGGIAVDKFNSPLPQETIDLCKKSDAVLMGAVGGPKWDNQEARLKPETGLLAIRKELDVYANIRPAKVFESLASASSLKKELLSGGLDIVVVRELTGGIYFGEKGTKDKEGSQAVYDTMEYTKKEIERVARTAFSLAQKRDKKIVSVDKANVLQVSRLWRETVIEVSKDYKDVELSHMYVDNAAMQLIRYPKQFDVILTSNLFGDIISDEASMLTGSLGMLPSASINDYKGTGLYEPVHGSAPDIAGEDKANPIAAIMSAAMMLRYSLQLSKAADDIKNAVDIVLKQNIRTADIMSEGCQLVGCREMGARIAEALL